MKHTQQSQVLEARKILRGEMLTAEELFLVEYLKDAKRTSTIFKRRDNGVELFNDFYGED